jgi:hypothetical protein
MSGSKGILEGLMQPQKDINNKNDNKEDNNNNIDKVNNNDNKKDNDTDNKNNIDKNIVIDNKKDIKKYIKIKPPKPEGYHCRLPHEYIIAIDEAKIITGFYKDELAQMAYDLLLKKLGIEIKKQ